jgi:ATP synthase protein I
MMTSSNNPDREKETSSQADDLSERLKDLSGRIAAERNEYETSNRPSRGYEGVSNYSVAFRLAAEFVAGTLVGGAIGYGIDWLFGTSPFGLIFFLLLGFGAGILNMARAAKRIPPAGERLGSTPPPAAIKDDEED